MTRAEQIIQEILTLPVVERVQVLEAVIHDLARVPRPSQAAKPVDAPSLLGLFADEPDLIDEVCRMAMEARRLDGLRARDGADESTP